MDWFYGWPAAGFRGWVKLSLESQGGSRGGFMVGMVGLRLVWSGLGLDSWLRLVWVQFTVGLAFFGWV